MKKIFLCAVALFLAAVAQSNSAEPKSETKSTKETVENVDQADTDKHSAQAETMAKMLRGQIRNEIKTLGNHAWAGEYYHGDGLGVNVSLILAPKAGYVFEWHGCMGLYDRNYGAVTWATGRLRLSFTFPNKREGFQGIAGEFVPIAWGDRKYLVPADGIVGFCNNVNDGSELRTSSLGLYLLQRGDEWKKVNGFPAVPDKFKPYLLTHPIEAEIVSVGASVIRIGPEDFKLRETPVTLNCGKKQGILVGMELHVAEPKNMIETVTITKVEFERSESVMTQIYEQIDERKGPQIGWKLSTRWPFYSK
jgi:hypothetical protein